MRKEKLGQLRNRERFLNEVFSQFYGKNFEEIPEADIHPLRKKQMLERDGEILDEIIKARYEIAIGGRNKLSFWERERLEVKGSLYAIMLTLLKKIQRHGFSFGEPKPFTVEMKDKDGKPCQVTSNMRVAFIPLK